MDYHDYLLTQEWKNIRTKVLDRANGLCEGCRAAPATRRTERTINMEQTIDNIKIAINFLRQAISELEQNFPGVAQMKIDLAIQALGVSVELNSRQTKISGDIFGGVDPTIEVSVKQDNEKGLF